MPPPAPRGLLAPSAVHQGRQALVDALATLDRDLYVVATDAGPAVAEGAPSAEGLPILAFVPALTPDRLGEPGFRAHWGARAAYVAGAMANGIASPDLVAALARGGMLAFLGAAGLPTARIAAGIDALEATANGLPWGVNLIHSPQEPRQEQETVELLLAKGVRSVEASAFLKLTTPIVQYRAAGLVEQGGRIVAKNRVMAKVSREEVALPFLRPAPEKLVRDLVAAGRITEAQGQLAVRHPMACDLTAEADSGGHTDNRPLSVLLPLLLSVRDRTAPGVRIGAAGGIGTPSAVAAAFAMGAAYVLTGSVNQACVESGTSELARRMLAEAASTDVGMAPASDMFEQGAQVQVLKRGTLFAMRGQKLYELWRRHDAWDEIPAKEREDVERNTLRRPFGEVWADCERFFAERDPAQVERAARDPRHQMALVFRWYLGLSSKWAIGGDEARRTDLQIWCGPAMGAFNDWTRGTFLANPSERRVLTVAVNLMAGAAAITRARFLLAQGVDPGPEAMRWSPRRLGGAR